MKTTIATRTKTRQGVRRDEGPRTRINWRERTLDRVRELILEADPAMIEERKWRKPSNGMVGIPVWSHDGIALKTLIKAAVKLNAPPL